MNDDTTDRATLPTSTREFNKMLDAQIVSREPIDWSDPWRQRRYWATLWSTIKAWFQ